MNKVQIIGVCFLSMCGIFGIIGTTAVLSASTATAFATIEIISLVGGIVFCWAGDS